uniref:Uncharacterized protein n=1 Tax=Wuchereria bancrofti TaxID=6293 RepID=A0AAF5PZY1_WUCBA
MNYLHCFWLIEKIANFTCVKVRTVILKYRSPR